jgi:DNA-binding NarL/FixJ family response regulator
MTSETERQKARVCLVADHPLVREHLTALLRREADLDVSGEAADGLTAQSLLSREEPDLVILDDSSKHASGLELLKDLKKLRPKLPVLVVSMQDETLCAERSLRAGAMGYITKEEATANVLSAVRKVLAGQVYVSERMAGRIKQKRAGANVAEVGSPLEVLTEREWEVFERIGRGLETWQVAEELRLGIKTVESYRARIREKLQLTDGGQLLQQASQWVGKPCQGGTQP